MKLIIDVPEELYNGIECRNPELETEYVCHELMKAVDNGTPLDDVKAEIQAKYDSIPWRNNEYDDGWIEALEWVLFSILDNIGKAESEETDGKKA